MLMSGLKEEVKTQNGKNKKSIKRNIKNTGRKWSEKIASIMRDKPENLENMSVSEKGGQPNTAAKSVIVVITINVLITTSIVDTGSAPMTNVVITYTMIIKGIGIITRVIGDLGKNGIDTPENIRRYTGMGDITVKMPI